MNHVNWSSYASVYDLMADNNPAYQEIIHHLMTEMKAWDLKENGIILDVGAGTGNFIIPAAALFPNIQFLHLDFDPQMIALTKLKIDTLNLNNIEFMQQSIELLEWEKLNKIQAIFCVHTLYAVQEHKQIIKKMHQFLQPGGYVFICDLGRVLNLIDWSAFYFRHLTKQLGVLNTLEIFWRGRNILKQNRAIRQKQLDGTYWTHSHEVFLETIRATGFSLLHNKIVYRGYSDLVIAQKI